MVREGLARRKLEQARFFTALASAAGYDRREDFVNFLEAAIVFSRSITLHLQKEYKHEPGFNTWYAAKQEWMNADSLLHFFLDTRNFILKQGPVGFHKRVSVILEGHATVLASIELKVIRGQPWYKRNMRIIWQDLWQTIIQPVRRWRTLLEREWHRRRAAARSKTHMTEGFFFDDPTWKDRTACDLLEEYLDQLEKIVVEAEANFDRESA